MDGVPHYITHEKTGLLFTSEDVDELAHNMDRLLSDPELYDRIAKTGRDYVFEQLNEEIYASKYYQMLERVVGKENPQ